MGRVAQSVQRQATGWTARGSNPDGGEIFRTCPDRPWYPPSLLYNGYRFLTGCKKRPKLDADPSKISNAVIKKEHSYTSTLPMGRTACTEPQCLYSTAIPLLPLRAVQPVQSIMPVQYSYTSTPPTGRTTCTEHHACTVQLYLYSAYGPYSLYRASVPVQYSYTSTPPMGRTACTKPQ